MNSNKNVFIKQYITIPELSYWCSPCALKTTISIDKDDNDISTTTISFKSKSVLINSVPIDDNTTIKIEGGVNYVGDYFSPNINQHTYIEILKQDNSSIEDFMQIYLCLSNFFHWRRCIL